MSRLVTVCGLAALTVAVGLSAAGAAVISELFINPPGNDAPNEYIEIRGNASEVLPAGTYLLGIEGDFGANAGDVQDIFDLSGVSLGTNGFLVLLQKGNPYSTLGGATVLTNAGTGIGWGNGATSSVGHSADGTATDIENASVTFMLVQTATAPTLTDDIDSDNNGTIDGLAASWTFLDAIGVLDPDTNGDLGYGAINFARNTGNGTSVTGPVVPTSFTAGYLGRIGNSSGAGAGDWAVGDSLNGAAPNWTLDDTSDDAFQETIPAAVAGTPLNHIGGPNPVPEPAAIVLLLAGAMAMCCLRRRM